MSLPSHPAPMRAHGLPLLGLLLVAVVTLWRLVLLGEVPFDAGYAARFRPWRASGAQAAVAAGPAVRAQRPDPRDVRDRYRAYWGSYLAGDQVVSTWPDHVLLHRRLREGRASLWEPDVLGGVPLFAGSPVSPWSPFTWPSLLLPLVMGRNLTLLLQLFAAGAALYGFMAARGRGRLAAFAGGVAYMLNPVHLAWLAFGDAVPVTALLPVALALLGALPGARRPARVAALLALVTGAQCLSTNAQFTAYALAAEALWLLVVVRRADERARVLAWAAAAFGAGALVGAVNLLPLAELSSLAWRPPARYADTNHLPPASLLTFLFPRLFGHPGHGDYVGGFLFFRPWFSLPGPGAATLVTALAAVGLAVRPRAAWMLAPGAALLALAVPGVHHAVAAAVPGFDGLDAMRALVLAHLGLAVLVGDGAAHLTDARAARPLLALALVALAAAAGLDVASHVVDGPLARQVRHLALGTLLLSPRVLAPLAVFAGLAALARARGLLAARAEHVRAVVVGLLALELVVMAWPAIPAAPRAQVLRVTPEVRALQERARRYPGIRFVGVTEPESFPPYDGDHLPPNTGAALGLDDLRGLSRLPPSPMVELFAALGGHGFPTIAPGGSLDLPVYDLLAVGYAMSDHPLPQPHWRQVAPSLWANRHAGPRAFFTRCARVVRGADARLDALTAPDFDPYGAALIEAPVAGLTECAHDPAPLRLTPRPDGRDRVRLDVDAPAAGVLVLSEAWYPGWRVSVDGVTQRALRVDHALRGAFVPAGRHRVVFSFAPESLADGAAFTLAGLVLVALGLVARRPGRASPDLLLGLASSVALAAFLRDVPFPNDNDCLYADVIRWVRDHGHWVSLQIEGVAFLDKPPLFFWAGALVTGVLGENEFALRLPALACGVATVVLTARLARRLTGDATAGWIAGLLLLTTPEFYEYSRRVYMEVPVALCVLASFDLASRGRWTGAGAVAGAGFMLKTLPGVMGVVPVAILEVLRQRRVPRPVLLAALLAVGMNVPWHLAAWRAAPQAFLDFTLHLHLRDQVISAQPWSTGGPLFYFEKIPRLDTVLSLAFVAGYVTALRDWWRTRDRALGEVLFAVTLQVVAYSAISTKKSFYMMPAFPFMAVLGARALGPWAAREARRVTLVAGALVLGFLVQAGALMMPDRAELPEEYLRDIARYAGRALPRAMPVYTYEVYFANPQFYARRPMRYAVPDAATKELIDRIPYLRYGDKVAVWRGALLDEGAVILRTDMLDEVLRRNPGARVLAWNEGYALVRRVAPDAAPQRSAAAAAGERADALRRAWVDALAHPPAGPDETYAAALPGPSRAAWTELLVAAGVPTPQALDAGASLDGYRLVIAADVPLAAAEAMAAPGRAVVLVGAGAAPLAAAAEARIGDVTLPLAGARGAALTLLPGERPLLVTGDGAVLAAAHPAGAGVVLRFGVDLGAHLMALRMGDPARANADRDGNGETQPNDLLAEVPAALRQRPFADLAVDAVLRELDRGLRCPLPRTRGLPEGIDRLVVLTHDQDFAPSPYLDEVARTLAGRQAHGTFLLTDGGVGLPRDLAVDRDGPEWLDARALDPLLAAGHGAGVHPFPRAVDDVTAHAARFAERYGFAPLVARNHHLRWMGHLDLIDAEARAGIVMNLDFMALGDGRAPSAGFALGSARPVRFVRDGAALSVLQQPTTLDDFSLRQGSYDALAPAAEALSARGRALLDESAAAGLPVVLNAHPTLHHFAPGWLDAILATPGTRGWSAEQWHAFVLRRRQSRVASPGCEAPPRVRLAPGVAMQR